MTSGFFGRIRSEKHFDWRKIFYHGSFHHLTFLICSKIVLMEFTDKKKSDGFNPDNSWT
jgi:hypothetical protein